MVCVALLGAFFLLLFFSAKDSSVVKTLDDCADLNIPPVSVDSALYAERGVVELRWSDPETGEDRFVALPYDPLGAYEACSDSAQRVLRHVSETNAASADVSKDTPKPVLLALTYAAQQAKANEDEVEILSVSQKDWPNACLGIESAPDGQIQMCAEVITPGYEAVFRVNGQVFAYRTNMDGTNIQPTPVLKETNEARVGVGETKLVGGIRIALHSVVQDYRCPVDAQCIQAGGIVANITLQSEAGKTTFNMPSDEAPRPFGSAQISIIGVEPSKISTEEPDPASYRIAFRVERVKN